MKHRTPRDDVAFLARSRHRVDVLDTLADGPSSRPNLHASTGIPQPTLGRILSSFQERGWVSRDGQDYALSSVGALLAAEFSALLDLVETIQGLEDVAHLLPPDELSFDVRDLRSARITTPQVGDVLRHMRRVEEVLGDATHIRIVTDTVWPNNFEDLDERTERLPAGDLVIESVVTGAAIGQALRDRHVVEQVREVLELGTFPVYRYDGTIPMNLALANDTAMLLPTDGDGRPGALVETEDATVRAWVEEQFTKYRDRSTELTLDDLPT